MKIAFVVILVIASAALWLRQRRDPELIGWGKDLAAALQQAKADNRLILVLFTDAPMTYDDKHAVKNVVTTDRTMSALGKLSYVRVHLNIEDNTAEAKTYKVESTPTYLLLDSSGRELRRTSGLMNDVTFIKEFLSGPGP
ncbi:MAG: hypothetical protein MUP47_08820 [Phycisphaerae bacterium]|nr:hypothetical protein [Phycisphaerae bacterium]